MKVERLAGNPIIVPDMDAEMGDNINGPSLIRVPEWLSNPLGKYYLYFAHHRGTYIRLAYADSLQGPWKTYAPGTLRLKDTFFDHHIASPDLHIDNERKELRMYFHGRMADETEQHTRLAISSDGINFKVRPEILGKPYMRVIEWGGWKYALGMPGTLYRTKDGLTNFEEGPTLFDEDMRHCALKIVGNTMYVFYSTVGETPERILLSKIDLNQPWPSWKETKAEVVLEPETDYEGADLPLEPSRRGLIIPRVRQLRDPGIFEENGDIYLLYSIAGEHGIGIAKLTDL